MSEPATAAVTLPDLIARLRAHVRDDMRSGDDAAEDVIEALDIAWLAAERWRLEQCGFHDRECCHASA
jgi:hypothetical protein